MDIGIHRSVPILPTTDVRRALASYARMGFDTDEWDQDYGFVGCGGREIFHLTRHGVLDTAANPAACYLFVIDADALHGRWEAAAVEGQLTAPEDKPWGLREGMYVDPDGNVLRFGSSLAHDHDHPHDHDHDHPHPHD